jgi:hypothetical protein
MATTTNFGWETPDDTDLVKDGALAIRTLGSAIDTSLVDLKGGTTGQVLSKASNTDMDFTWTADASGIPATIFDAKGDIIAATAADTASRLAVGLTDGQVLKVKASAATGLEWGDATVPLQTWTPTYTNITVGNGTVIARYADFGNFVWAYFHFTLGSTSSIGTNATLNSFPVSMALDGGSVNSYQNGSTGKAVDASAGLDYLMLAQIVGATNFSWWSLDAASTYVRNTTRITATVPFTWATSDELSLSVLARKA